MLSLLYEFKWSRIVVPWAYFDARLADERLIGIGQKFRLIGSKCNRVGQCNCELDNEPTKMEMAHKYEAQKCNFASANGELAKIAIGSLTEPQLGSARLASQHKLGSLGKLSNNNGQMS